jgi:hypothetical protein
MSNNTRTPGNLLRIAAIALIVAALYQELRKPPGEREWHGKVANFVPYDFRMPTGQRLRERFWNPGDPRIFTEHVFGVGWAINFYTVLRKLQMLKEEPSPPAPEDSE